MLFLAVRRVKVDWCVLPVYCSGQSIVSQIVSLVYFLSVLVSVKHTVLNKRLGYH